MARHAKIKSSELMNQVRACNVILAFVAIVILISGCGETFRGVKKDTTRVAKGVKTIFVSN